MITFSHERISPHITRIRDGSDVCEYLIEGNCRAALIDTGYGVGDLKGYVETLTGKPYDVFVTHGHVDHASGSAPYEKVYLNAADLPLIERYCTLSLRKEKLRAQGLEFPDAAYLPPRTASFAPLEDGMEFDLGGLTLRWIAVPGHTPGTMVPLIAEERTVIFGDACGVGVLLSLPESCTVETYYCALQRLQTFEPLYDVVLRQHGSCASTKAVLKDNIENCERILAGTDAAEPVLFRGNLCFRAARTDPATGARADGREGNIMYDRNRIR